MIRSPLHLVPLVFAGLLLTGDRVRAELVNWTYTLTPSPVPLNPTAGTGSILLESFSGAKATTLGQSSGVVLAYALYPTLAGSQSATFNNSYAVTLGIKDPGGATGNLTITGTFQGTLSAGGSTIDFNTKWTSSSLTLGNHVYTVTLNPYFDPPYPIPPGAGSFAIPGILSANVAVTSPTVKQAPEPTSLALVGLALPLLGLAAWRRRSAALAA